MSWPCNVCTFVNPARKGKCDMCQSSKTAKAVVAVKQKAAVVPPTCGLVGTSGEVLPLQAVAVQCQITHNVCAVSLQQTYLNPNPAALDVTYLFPITENAAINGFIAKVGDRTVKGVVQGKQEARETYQKAKALGDGAFLMEQKTKNLFEIKLGNVPGNGTVVVITVQYVVELIYNAALALELVLPATLLAPATTTTTTAATTTKEKFSLQASVQMTSDITAITSPTHAVTVTNEGKQGTVTFTQSTHLTAALKLVIAVACVSEALVVVEKHPGKPNSHALMLSFVPQVPSTVLNTEILFLVDRSGSMSGSRMAQCADTLMNAIAALPAGIHFNIIGYGTTHKAFFPLPKTSYEVTDETRILAMLHAAGMKASMRGTNILSPLLSIFNTPVSPNLARQIFLMTDGEVKNTTEIIKTVRKESASTRVFTFGIGRDASVELCRGVARAGGGEAEFCVSAAAMHEQVSRQLQRSLTPAITQLKLWWYGLDVLTSPYNLRPVFHNTGYTVYGLIEGKQAIDLSETAVHKAKLFGKLPDGSTITYELHIDIKQAVSGEAVHVLAGREAIRDLEEGTSALHTPYPACYEPALQEIFDTETVKQILSYCEDDREIWPACPDVSQVNAAIKTLGLAVGIASTQTSFVAIDERTDADREVAQQEAKLSAVVTADEVEEEAAADGLLQVAMQQSQAPQAPRQRRISHEKFRSLAARPSSLAPTSSSSSSSRASSSAFKAKKKRGPPAKPSRAFIGGSRDKALKADSRGGSRSRSRSPPLERRARAKPRPVAMADDSDESDDMLNLNQHRLGYNRRNINRTDRAPRPNTKFATLEFGPGERVSAATALDRVSNEVKTLPAAFKLLSVTPDKVYAFEITYILPEQKTPLSTTTTIKTGRETKTALLWLQLPADFPKHPPIVVKNSSNSRSVATLQILKQQNWIQMYSITLVLLLCKLALEKPQSDVLHWPPRSVQVPATATLENGVHPPPPGPPLERPPNQVRRPNFCR